MMAARKKRAYDLDDPADALEVLTRLAEASRLADAQADLARAERDSLIARTLTNRVATGVEVASATGLTQPRCVQIRRLYAVAPTVAGEASLGKLAPKVAAVEAEPEAV